jgi:hypothetical protein
MVKIIARFILNWNVLDNADRGAYEGRDGGGALFGQQLGQPSAPACVRCAVTFIENVPHVEVCVLCCVYNKLPNGISFGS